MRFSTGLLRGPAVLAAACGLLAATACTSGGETDADGGSVEPGPDAVAEAQRLHQIANESRAISDELTEIEHRITKRCLEDEGFSVHDPMKFQASNTAAYGAAGYLTDAPVRAVPTPEAAEQWGFGVWTEFVRNPGNEDLADELLTPEVRTAFSILDEEDYGEPDTSEWDAEDEEYQAGWIEAYSGSPAMMEEVKGPQIDYEAPPGGCWLQMVETMYGEPYMMAAEDEDGEEGGEHAVTHEPSPLFTIGEFEDFSELFGAVRDEADAFEICLLETGYEAWELSDDLSLPLWQYLGSMYDPAHFEEYGEDGVEVPEAPEDVPGDFMGVLELERAMAVDFAACGQESGLRKAIEQGWAAMLVEAFQPIETDLVAWQETMQGHLDNAQEALEE
ncbi:hypothetical protein [Glycomyces rhizosphaerae]|uniref:TRAP-type C4-dicarboxylate transport system, substrate-binding protein n=1 Tax=Glycomyces rhizosphaerae TaxID=2054422 RepID=A0ABV7Q2K6_9ACTN